MTLGDASEGSGGLTPDLFSHTGTMGEIASPGVTASPMRSVPGRLWPTPSPRYWHITLPRAAWRELGDIEDGATVEVTLPPRGGEVPTSAPGRYFGTVARDRVTGQSYVWFRGALASDVETVGVRRTS